jgi:enediyne biosynthesis protein E4
MRRAGQGRWQRATSRTGQRIRSSCRLLWAFCFQGAFLGSLLGPTFAPTAQVDDAPLADFRNVAAESGLTATVPNGGVTSKEFIVETTGSGVAWIDYDADGLLDAFVVSGPPRPGHRSASNRLYRNVGRGRFADVTEQLGLLRSGWGQGVCSGDYDNDGFTDLFLTSWGPNALYRNLRGRRWEDVTALAGLAQDRVRYNTGCAFLDYDGDSDLDLFVANYLQFDFESTPKPGANPYCYYRGMPVTCGPRGLPFDSNLLYRNNGDGTFTDVSAPSGVGTPRAHYALGVVTGDFNGDGRVDIYVACDQTPSLLYINEGDGRFREDALLRGAALDANGKPLSGMGVTVADYDGSGTMDIFRTNFSDERETLYRNRGLGQFDDVTASAGMAHNTRFVGWGCGFFDFDHDGWKDLLLVNGHLYPEVDRLGIDVRYRERAILYRNLGGETFADISWLAGPAVLERHAARGAAFGDMDNDGSIEVLINNQNEPPSLFKQQRGPRGNWIILKLEGIQSNRSAIGAHVTVRAGGRIQTDEVRSGGSYLSQNDLRLHFGVGGTAQAEVEIRWPSGTRQRVLRLPVNRVHVLREQLPELPGPYARP